MHAAIGVKWHGRATAESTVLYIAGEGQLGLRARVSAWLRHVRGLMAKDPTLNPDHLNEALRERFFAIPSAVPLLDPLEPDNLLSQVRAAIDRLGTLPDLIVLDTLARCFLGGDENSSRDMGRFVEACDLIRKETGATVLVIHHTGKDGDIERGSSALRGGADAMLRIVREERDDLEGAARLVVEKRKDGAPLGDLVFDMQLVELDPRADGRPMSSLVPVPSTSPQATVPQSERKGRWRRRRRKGGAAKAQRLDILKSLASTFRRKGASATNLIADSQVPRSSAYKRLNELAEEGFVVIRESRGADIYEISKLGLESLSIQSPVSQSLAVSETSGQSPVSRKSPPPPTGGRDDTETETKRDAIVSAEQPHSLDRGRDADSDAAVRNREADA